MFVSSYSDPRKPGLRYGPLAISLLVTAGLFGLMLLISTGPRSAGDAATLVVFAARAIPAPDRPRPDPDPVDQAERLADTPEEAAPASAPRTIAPAPAVPVVPPVQIALAPLKLPEVPRMAEGTRLALGGDSAGERATGAEGPRGNGGDGIAGNGKGGAGNGAGAGNQLRASWAPDMDFSQNARVYPREARIAGIEGAAWLNCFVLRNDRVRDCKLVAERPVGHGFGKAALKTEKGLRIRVHNQAGRRIYNEWVVVRTVFKMPDRPEQQAEAKEQTEGETEPAAPAP